MEFDSVACASHADQIHAVDIVAFIEARDIPFLYFKTPYRLAPVSGGEQFYALLCDELHRSQKIGIAQVVIQTQPHLAILVPQGQSLMLATLRWVSEADRPPQPDEDISQAAGIAMTMPRCRSGIHHGSRHPAFQPDLPVLGEHEMKEQKTEEFFVEELASLLDDAELIDERCLWSATRQPLHPHDGYAMRGNRARSRRITIQRRRLRC
ncbi:MAG TPA: Ku protein [Noviherbaspirillum sp.]|nr:Ku protein [Noviherbaspirillum sp.]